MKCRICNKEIGNNFQLVCDKCTKANDEQEVREDDWAREEVMKVEE